MSIVAPRQKPSPKSSTERAAQLRREMSQFPGRWYSPIDFGDGVIARGPSVQRRFARRMQLLQIPEDLAGKRVLDIGAWDGFWSFEMERRGADVTSVDIWTDEMLAKFLYGREKLGSQVRYLHADIHSLNPQEIGTFDLVFCAGVLYHLRHPLLALEKIRALTHHMLILETVVMMPFVNEQFPMIGFFPGDREARAMGRQFGICGAATMSWLTEALAAVGFDRVDVKYRPSLHWWHKLKALAVNRPQGGRGILHAFVDQPDDVPVERPAKAALWRLR